MSTIARSLLILFGVLHRIIGLAGLIVVLILINARHGTKSGAATRGGIP
jgi:hypothetical protein